MPVKCFQLESWTGWFLLTSVVTVDDQPVRRPKARVAVVDIGQDKAG